MIRTPNKGLCQVLAIMVALLALAYCADSRACEGTDLRKYYPCQGGWCKR